MLHLAFRTQGMQPDSKAPLQENKTGLLPGEQPALAIHCIKRLHDSFPQQQSFSTTWSHGTLSAPQSCSGSLPNGLYEHSSKACFEKDIQNRRRTNRPNPETPKETRPICAAAVRKKLECMLFSRSKEVATRVFSSFSSSYLDKCSFRRQ